jgi:hypothetical protein
MGIMKPVIELHIEEIVLHGFPSLDRRQCSQIREVLQRQLTDLLARDGLPPSFMQGGTVQRLDGGTFQSAAGAYTPGKTDMPDNAPGDIGANIAGNVYRGLSRSTFSREAHPEPAGKGGKQP